MRKYDLSKIMKLAHHIRKYEGLTMSVALTLAWNRAKREPFYWIAKERKARTNRIVNDSSSYQDMMISYYNRGSSAYYGD